MVIVSALGVVTFMLELTLTVVTVPIDTIYKTGDLNSNYLLIEYSVYMEKWR